jgi:hypothetical protein
MNEHKDRRTDRNIVGQTNILMNEHKDTRTDRKIVGQTDE